jgi:endonuclease YncB( thermonuclease family)
MTRGQRSTTSILLAFVIGAALWWFDHRVDTGAELVEYRRLDECGLAPHPANDGDSFHVRIPDGRTIQIRLHFVDAPESSVRRYRDGNDNRRRLRDQGEYFGNLGEARTTAVGQLAKKTTADLLGARKFTIFTRWQPVFGGPRFYGFVRLHHGGEDRWLHELLVEQGLGRIHTEGATLPDGTQRADQERHLRQLEKESRRARRGGWGTD